MTRTSRTIEINDVQDLATLAREVRATQTPCILRVDGEEVAVIMPARMNERTDKGKPTSEDDPLWNIVGTGRSSGPPSNISEHVDQYLTETYVSKLT